MSLAGSNPALSADKPAAKAGLIFRQAECFPCHRVTTVCFPVRLVSPGVGGRSRGVFSDFSPPGRKDQFSLAGKLLDKTGHLGTLG